MILDNPIWSALTTIDANKNIGSDECVFTDAAIAPFIAMPTWDIQHQRMLLEKAPNNRSWYLLIADEMNFIDEFELVSSIPLYQFICPKLILENSSSKNDSHPTHQTFEIDEIVPLTNSHINEMVALIQLTKPGPFRERTIEFGNYHGILKEGKLVAMGGERLHLDGYTEVSAICTHPNNQGQGYAAKITAFLTDAVLNDGKIPFLHARHDNEKAIAVYKRLGYQFRAVINFYIIKKK